MPDAQGHCSRVQTVSHSAADGSNKKDIKLFAWVLPGYK